MSDSLEFNVDLSNYSGSLEILLDLAKSQKVDLENISITKLADQFHDFITKTENLNLEELEDLNKLINLGDEELIKISESKENKNLSKVIIKLREFKEKY